MLIYEAESGWWSGAERKNNNAGSMGPRYQQSGDLRGEPTSIKDSRSQGITRARTHPIDGSLLPPDPLVLTGSVYVMATTLHSAHPLLLF
jgi:hypothetical protein